MNASIQDAAAEILVLFGKQPRPGQVKTRLSPPLGEEQACGLYRAFLSDICARQRPPEWALVLAVAPPLERGAFLDWIPERLDLTEQRGPDLGARLIALFEDQFEREHARRVVVRNTDSPLLAPELERKAFRELDQGAEIVLGPDLGGGYYLVGMSRPFPDLFRLEMSVPSNFEHTLDRARELTGRVALLDPAPDVDQIEDLRRLANSLAEDPAARALAPRTAHAVAELSALL